MVAAFRTRAGNALDRVGGVGMHGQIPQDFRDDAFDFVG